MILKISLLQYSATKNGIVAEKMQRKTKSLQNDCNESIVKKKGVELDEKIQSISFRRYESVI